MCTNRYAANRVTAVKELTYSIEWHYVSTLLNPADILLRGSDCIEQIVTLVQRPKIALLK